MSSVSRFATLLIFFLFLAGLPVSIAQDGGGIAWDAGLAAGLAKAKETGRPLMICVNAKHVEGREDEEPAAKGLREVVYRDARVVEKSRLFVCVLLTPTSSTQDYAELGELGIEGRIVSPQHIFVNAGGDRILLRREYWSHGKGEKAVTTLLTLMDRALGKGKAGADTPKEEISDEDRAKWIAQKIKELEDDSSKRHAILDALVQADKDGDCLSALLPLLKKYKKDKEMLWSLIHALGYDGFEAGALPIAKFLKHRELSIRGCSAVSLEHIGSREKDVISALVKAVGREKDEVIANHMYRALGRCGVEQKNVRTLLLKAATNGKSEFATYGPAIALAYFEDDAAAARGVERMLKLIGIPGGRRGGGQNTVKRGLVSWTLASIGHDKSGKFVREELMAKLKNVKAFWVEGLHTFWDTVARVCEGEDEELAGVEAGVKVFVGFAKRAGLGRYGAETRDLMDDNRKWRDNSKFVPKGDNLLGSSDGD